MEGRTIQRELISALWPELEPLGAAHLAETGLSAGLFQADRAAYASAESAGSHRFDTVRLNGALIGYSSVLLYPSRFDGALEAHEDCIYVLPAHRGYVGRDLEHFQDTALASAGVLRVFRERVIHDADDRALRRGPIGYTAYSVLFLRRMRPDGG